MADPGGEEGRRRSFEVTSIGTKMAAHWAFLWERRMRMHGEHETKGTKAKLRDMGTKVEAH